MTYYDIQNRRYVGSKYKLMEWILGILKSECKGTSFFDVFAGTGVVSSKVLELYDEIIINDFLYSNFAVYHAFFSKDKYSVKNIEVHAERFASIDIESVSSNYFDLSFGGKFFSENDAKIIGYIRKDLQYRLNEGSINQREFDILLASLIYSADKVANTVGHYDAYIKNKLIHDRFKFILIRPLDTESKSISIYREDSNALVRKIKSDIAFIDPPYNSRQYARFYHILENLAKWEEPVLHGVALKPEPENVSEYSKSTAPLAFEDLIKNINAKYIAVTYNNTYNSKSSSSKNKITYDQIMTILEQKGKTKVFCKEHPYFNAGKTSFADHKEYLFITEVND